MPPTSSPSGVAIIDPHSVLRFGIRQLLSRNSLKVCWEAECSGSARELIEDHRPDMVIYEPIFEMTRSMAFLGFLHSTYPDLRVVVQTMAIENSEISSLLNRGVLALVSKTGDMNELLLGMESARIGQAYVSPHFLNGMRTRSNEVTVNVAALTAREREVFRLVGLGQKVSEIAKSLGISPRTVDAHKQHIKDKLALDGNTSMAAAAGRWLHRNWAQPGGSKI